MNSLASTDPVGKAEVRLVARNNEILATRKTDESGHVLFEAGLARGEGGLSPAMLTVTGEKADYAFLSLKTSAFDLSDRGVSGRAVPRAPMPSSMPSAASIAPARPSISPRSCATGRAMPLPAGR